MAYHKTTKPFSFSLQIIHAGELKHEFIFAAESEAIMHVWMEVRGGRVGERDRGREGGRDRKETKNCCQASGGLGDELGGCNYRPKRSRRISDLEFFGLLGSATGAVSTLMRRVRDRCYMSQQAGISQISGKPLSQTV